MCEESCFMPGKKNWNLDGCNIPDIVFISVINHNTVINNQYNLAHLTLDTTQCPLPIYVKYLLKIPYTCKHSERKTPR